MRFVGVRNVRVRYGRIRKWKSQSTGVKELSSNLLRKFRSGLYCSWQYALYPQRPQLLPVEPPNTV
jgi:hypothetical protein